MWTLFSFHPLKFSLLLYLIENSLLLKSLFCCLQRHWSLWVSPTSTNALQPPSVSFPSAPSPLAIHRILPLVPLSSCIFNPGNLICLLIQISFYTLCTPKFSPTLFLKYVPSCLLASSIHMFQCHSNLTCPKIGLIKFFCSQFFQVNEIFNESITILADTIPQISKFSLTCHIHFLAEVLRRRCLSQNNSMHLRIEECGWLNANLSLKLETIFCVQQSNLLMP